MNQGYVSAAAPSPADHVKAAAAASMSGSVWMVGTGRRHRFLCHCSMLRHLPPSPRAGARQGAGCQGAPNSFFPPLPGARCQPSGLQLRAAPRRCSERGRGGCTLRVLGGNTAAAAPRGAACSMACSTAAPGTVRCCRVPPRTAYIRTKYLYTAVSISIKTRYTSAQLCVDHFSKYFGVDTRYTLQ